MQVLGGVVVLVVGAALTLLGLGMANAARHRRRTGVVTPGVIVGAEAVRNSTGAMYDVPVVEFRDGSGAVRRFSHNAGTRLRPPVGKQVRVWFDPSDPAEPPVIDDAAVNRVVTVAFTLAGLVALAVGVALLVPA